MTGYAVPAWTGPESPQSSVPVCEFCGRARQLEPCCTSHAAVMVCADRLDCSEYCLALERQAIAAAGAGIAAATRTMLTGEATDA